MRKDHFGNMSLSFPSLITELCSKVPRQDDFYEINNLRPINEREVSETDKKVASIKTFHHDKWGGKGSPDWQRPTIDAAAPRR